MSIELTREEVEGKAKAMRWTDPEIEGTGRIAYHEAGNAVMAMSFGFQVHAISVIPIEIAAVRSWIEIPPMPFPTDADEIMLALVAAAGHGMSWAEVQKAPKGLIHSTMTATSSDGWPSCSSRSASLL